MRGLVIGLTVGLAALAGCSKPADNAAASATNIAASAPVAATAPVAAAPAGPPGPITVAQLPAPTAGLWTRTSTQDGKPQPPGSKCLNGNPIDPLDGMAMKCPKMDATRTASGGFVVIATCANGTGVSAKLSLAGEGDFAKSFATDASLEMSGGGRPPVRLKNHSDWTYAGPNCPK